MIWDIVAEPLSQRRIVELHEVDLQVLYRYADDEDQRYTNNVKIKHIRSKTASPSWIQTCTGSQLQGWKYYDENKHLGTELCADIVYFNFGRDWAYFTKDTLFTWMALWRRCSEKNPEFPLNDEAGLALRTNLRYLVFDASILFGDDEFYTANGSEVRGNEENMRGLGPGLASFMSLEEVILVLNEDPHVPIDEGLSSIHLTEPQPSSAVALQLSEAAEFFRELLEVYFQGYRPYNLLTRLPPKTRPKPQKMPVIKTMIRTI